MAPEFLTREDVLLIHRDQIARYGGSPHTRDMGLLDSAIEMPRAMYGGQYLHADIFEMAGAYVFHIVKNHPFTDGNKRTGIVAGLVFLDINGIELDIEEMALYEFVISIAQGDLDKAVIAKFLREHLPA